MFVSEKRANYIDRHLLRQIQQVAQTVCSSEAIKDTMFVLLAQLCHQHMDFSIWTSSVNEQKSAVFLTYVCPHLPTKTVCECIQVVLMGSQRPLLNGPRVLLCKLLSRLPHCCMDLVSDEVVAAGQTLVKSWLDSASWNDDHVERELERAIFLLLESSTLGSTVVQAALNKVSPSKVLSRCLRSKKPDSDPMALLPLLVESNIVRYAAYFVKGLTDTTICREDVDDTMLVVMETEGSLDLDDDSLSSIAAWRQNFMTRIRDVLSQTGNDQTLFPEAYFNRLARCLKIQQNQWSIVDPSLIAQLTLFLAKRKVHCTNHLNAALSCSLPLLELGHSWVETRGLAFIMLHSLSVQIPLYLKARKRSPVGAVQASPLLFLEWLCEILESNVSFNIKAVHGPTESEFAALIRSCVRSGLKILGTSSGEDQRQPVASLKVVRKLLAAVSDESRGLAPAFPPVSTLASGVIDLCTTHSNCRAVLSVAQMDHRCELATLLLTCLQQVDTLVFDGVFWGYLLDAFDAGTCQIDILLRKIILVYKELSSPGEKRDDIPDLNLVNMKWSSIGGKEPRDLEENDWGWFIDGIVVERVHATLRSFLWTDSVDLDNVHSHVEELSRDLTLHMPYSPGFVIPMTLAFLEARIGYDLGNSPLPETSVDRAVTLSVQRLCEKGVLAICLMALCCENPDLRRYSASVLGLMIMVIHSDDARSLSSWRDRPQLAMLLDSVQRALVAHSNHVDKSVLRVPPHSALFLAKASLIVQRPSDRLYGKVNRVFLRISKEHGAFQEFFRIPSFIALFCSTAEESDQVAAERTWALHLLVDGFLNEMCYKPLISCHGPELLLSTLDNSQLRLHNDETSETALLILTALIAIVSKGGERCLDHAVNRLGILSFLRGSILGRQAFDLFRTSKARVMLLMLLDIILSKSTQLLSQEEYILATSGLVQGLVSFYHKVKQVRREGDRTHTQTIGRLVCKCLLLLTKSSTHHLHGQIDLDEALVLISATAVEERPTILTSLCRFNIAPYPADNIATVHSFCVVILESLATRLPSDNRTVLLKALLGLLKQSQLQGPTSRSDMSILLKHLLVLQQKCSWHRFHAALWKDCIRCLMASGTESTKDTSLWKIAGSLAT